MNLRTILVALFASLIVYSAQETPAGKSQPSPEFLEHYDKGKQGLKERKFDDAIAAFKKALKVDPGCADCYFGVAAAYSQKGDANHALEFSDKSLAAAQEDVSRAAAHNLKGGILMALGESDPGRLKDAETEFRQAVQFRSGTASYSFNLAKALAMQSKADEAKQEFTRCLSLNPDEETARNAKLIMADPRRARAEIAPLFHLTTLQGQNFSLADASGRVLVMDFWATWCPPCRESVPELKALTKKYPSEKLVLVSVSADADDQAWRDFVGRKKMDWMQYRDVDHSILHAFGIHAFPTYLVITGDGIVKRRIVGMNPQETIVHRLKETLQSMPELE